MPNFSQPFSALLTALNTAGSGTNKLPYYPSSNNVSLADVTTFGLSVLNQASGAALLTTLGIGTGNYPVFDGLYLGSGTGNHLLVFNSGASTTPGLLWQVAGSSRWLFYTTDPETGSDAGCNLVFGRAFDDSGTGIDNPITITRAAGGLITITRPTSFNAGTTLYGASVADGTNITIGTSSGSKIGIAATAKIGLYGVAPVVQPASANQAAITLSNTDNEIGGLTVSASYSQSEVGALRDKCEELADDVRSLSTLVHALRSAAVALGSIKGSA